MGTLASGRQTPAMPQAAITTEIHKPLDAHGHLSAKVALNLVRTVDHLADLGNIHFAELIRLGARIKACFIQYLSGCGPTYPVDVRESYLHTLVLGEVNPCYTRHDVPPGDKTNADGGLIPDAACASGSRK
jgi:hypothetical protein